MGSSCGYRRELQIDRREVAGVRQMREVIYVRKVAKTLLVILGVIVVIEIVTDALRLFAWRSRNHQALHLVKRFDKYVENPVRLWLRGRSSIIAIVHHVGRRFGKPYAAPVIAHRSDQGVIIPLPYGTEVDEPVVVDIADVMGLLPTWMVRTVRLNGACKAAQLHVSGSVAPALA